MTMTSKHYRVPMVGSVRDWITFSGDPDDPVRPVGIMEQRDALDGDVRLQVVSLDVEQGTALVSVEADTAFHAKLDAHLIGKTPQQVAAAHGYTLLKRGRNPRPEVSLRFVGT